jgi:hypothetical protein
MPKVVISRQSSAQPQEAYSKVKSLLADDQDLKKLDPSYKTTFNDSKLSGQAAGKMFKAELAVKASAEGCEVEIVVDLPFALSLAKGLVQRTLQKKLDESLA